MSTTDEEVDRAMSIMRDAIQAVSKGKTARKVGSADD
jgi:hypothetical protein